MKLLLVALAVQTPGPDTVRFLPMEPGQQLHSTSTPAGWGKPDLTIAKPGGEIAIWLRLTDSAAVIAALVPDRHYYWGDDFVVSLDTEGNGGAGPGHDDFQWYLRRNLDSSVVLRGREGRWHPPRDDPDWRLGPERSGGGWWVRAATNDSNWWVILVLDPAYLRSGVSRLALRVFDDDPQGWYPWPPRFQRQPTEVERIPDRWATVILQAGSR